ncbi:MAG: hypothetical protein QNK24_13640, partial [Desulfuromusa sp.]|nr:hypothetical protein [Desulfuromusa sp.]
MFNKRVQSFLFIFSVSSVPDVHPPKSMGSNGSFGSRLCENYFLNFIAIAANQLHFVFIGSVVNLSIIVWANTLMVVGN